MPDANEMERALDALRDGGVVAFPTDTVYGLGVSVAHCDSPAVLYDIKRRDREKPVAWLVASPAALDDYGVDVDARVRELARRHWPGGLTVIVKAARGVNSAFRSGAGTIGLRMPASETALALVRALGNPIATTSANVSGSAAPRSLAEVSPELLAQVDAVVPGGEAAGGVASTVLDCSEGEVKIVRQGGVMTDTNFDVSFSFRSSDGASTIRAKLWSCADFGQSAQDAAVMPRGIVQIVHGMAEYIDRYDDLARYLVDRGFVVCAEDHIGHGKSSPDEASLGHMPVEGGKDILIGDVEHLRQVVAECYPGVPYVLYGHSMGSFIARAYIARHGENLSACVLSGTGNVPAPLSKAGRLLAKTLARARGERYRSKLVDSMGAGAYGSQIPDARTPLDWLSTDEAVVDAYIDDPLCGFMFTVGGYSTLLDLTAEVVTPACAEAVPKDLPVLLVAGDGDPVGDMGAGVRAAAELLREAGVKRVDEVIYPGMRHEIHNEIGHEQVYDDVASWIEKAVEGRLA